MPRFFFKNKCIKTKRLGNENVHAKCDESADGGEK